MGLCTATSQPKRYRPRNPKASPLWQCLKAHFDAFVHNYQDLYEKEFGFFRVVIEKVVDKFLDCGDLAKGFARAKCEDCGETFIFGFSCACRYFCPSCHQK